MNISHRILTGSASALLRKTQLLLVTLITAQAASADTLSSSADLRILSFNGDGNDAGGGNLALYNQTDGTNTQRIFLNFDFSGYSGKSVTTDATLALVAETYGGGYSFLAGVSLGAANAAWTAAAPNLGGITWNNQPGLTAISGATNPNGNFNTGDNVTWTLPWYMLEKMATTGSGYNNGLGITSDPGSTLHFLSTAGGAAPTLAFSAVTAASSTLTGTTGNWTDTANWASTTVAQGISQTATIDGGTAANITMDANRSVGALAFSGANHTISSGAGKLALNVTSGAPTISVETGRIATIGATVVGINGLTKNSPGTLTLTGANTYTGATTLTDGVLSVATIGLGGAPSGNLGSAKNAAANLVFDGGTLQYTGATATTDRNFTINAGKTATFDITVNNLTVNGTTPATNGGLTKTGAGTLTIGVAQIYTGATTISGGTLKLGAGLVAPPVAGYSQWFDASTLSGSNGASISAWANGGTGSDATVPSGNGAPTLISNAGTGTGLSALQFNPGGGATTSQSLTFTRDTNARTVFSIFKGSGFMLTDSNEYDFHRSSDTNAADPLLVNYGQIDYLGTVRVNGVDVNSTVDAMPTGLHNGYNLISLTTNGNPVQVNGFNRDRVYHSGNQSQAEVLIYDTVLNSTDRLAVESYLNYKWFGIGSAGGGGSLSSSSPVTIASSATFDLNSAAQQIASLTGPSGASVTNSGTADSLLTISGASSTTFGGVISDGATNKISFVKSGAGTVTLSGVNTYTGATTVNAGTLLVSGSISGSAVTVNGGTLGGSGGTVGPVTVASGGTLAPGASTGLLTSTGNVTFASGATLSMEINGTTAGTGYDRLIVGGDVALGGATLSLSVGFTPVSQVDIFTLIENNGANPVSGTFTGLANGDTITVGMQDYQISYFDDASTLGFELSGGNDVSLLAVPEPASVLTLLGGLGVLAGLRRRRS